MATTLTPKSAPGSPAESTDRPSAPHGSPRRRSGVLVAGAVALAAVVGIGIVLSDQGDSPDPVPAPASSAPAPSASEGGLADQFGSADAMETWLGERQAQPGNGSPDARERWLAEDDEVTDDTAPVVEHPTTIRPS